jgi:CHAT domain-containing protein
MINLGELSAAEELITRRIQASIRLGKINYLGVMYGLSAEINHHNNQPQKEIVNYWKCFRANQKINYAKGCSESLLSIATTLNNAFNKMDSAIYYARAAFRFADYEDSLNILNFIATVYSKQKRFREALQYYQQCFDKLSKGINENELLNGAVENKIHEKFYVYVSELIINKANAYFDHYLYQNNFSSIKESIRIYKIADAFLEKMKSGHLEIESKLFWRKHSRKLYENAIQACYITKNNEEAFYFFERSRAVLLDDQLKNQRGMSDQEIVKQAALKMQRAELKKQISGLTPGSDDFTNIQKKIYANAQEQETLMKKLHKDAIVEKNAKISIECVQKQLLNNHEALIELFSGDRAVFMIAIKKSGIDFIKIEKKEYEKLTRSFLDHLSKPNLYRKQFELFLQHSHDLYKLLFQQTDIAPGRMIISPDSENFPFEVLVKSIDGNKIKYLLEDHAMSYTYSAGYLLNQTEDNKVRARGDFFGIAPVKYATNLGLTNLYGSSQSLSIIGSAFDKPKTLQSTTATRKNFLDYFSQYSIIHLYTHATANVNDEDPVIYFADSALYLNDLVIKEKPLASLIVLAACESGLGKFYLGEGVFSFNRAFAAIGIPSSVVNLWSVDNKSTYQINELFYKNLAAGMEFDIALQQAKLSFLQTANEDKVLPYYWGATILAGRSDNLLPTPSNKRSPWLYVTAFIVTVFLLSAVMMGFGDFRFKMED